MFVFFVSIVALLLLVCAVAGLVDGWRNGSGPSRD